MAYKMARDVGVLLESAIRISRFLVLVGSTLNAPTDVKPTKLTRARECSRPETNFRKGTVATTHSTRRGAISRFPCRGVARIGE